MNCPKCGLTVEGGSSFCNHCGAPLNDQGKTLNMGATTSAAQGTGTAAPALDAMDAAALTGMATATEMNHWDEYPSLRTAFPPLVLVLILWIVLIVLIRFFLPFDRRPIWNGHDALSWGLTLGAAVVMLLMFLRNLIRLRSIRYRLTSQRIFIQYGILNKRTDEIELEKYKDVFVNQDFWDKLVGCGDIQVVTGDVTNPTINMNDVTDPIGKKESIRNAARERQAKLGLRLREQM